VIPRNKKEDVIISYDTIIFMSKFHRKSRDPGEVNERKINNFF
jgi:hypothetical protein